LKQIDHFIIFKWHVEKDKNKEEKQK